MHGDSKSGKGLYVRADNSNTAIRALEAQLNELKTGGKASSLTYSEYDENSLFFSMVFAADSFC